MEKYQKLYERNPYTDPYFLVLMEVHSWKKLSNEFKLYSDGKPLLRLRKMIVLLINGSSLLC